jgi:hypothetical protein
MSKHEQGTQTYEPAQGMSELDNAQRHDVQVRGAHRSPNTIAFAEDT